jgi:uncharacterized protein YecE (DUF72 family)
VVTTSDFSYIRFHGSHWLYSSCYSDEELESWAQNIKKLGVSTVYVYFNNDAEGFAIRNALKLKNLLGVNG